MKHLILLIFAATFIFFDHQLGYTATSPWWTHVTYNFQHANLWHLILNSISFYYLFRALERAIPFRAAWRKFATCALLPLSIATAASFFCTYQQPVVGASGMVYAMIGIYFAILLKNRKKSKPATLPFSKGEYRKAGRGYFKISPIHIFVISVTTFLIIGFFKTNTAAMLHLACCLLGFLITPALTLQAARRIKPQKQ